MIRFRLLAGSSGPRRAAHDSGQVLAPVAVVLVLVVVLGGAVVRLGATAARAAHAQAAADAVALAGAAAGRSAATEVARANGVGLLGYQNRRDAVSVSVASDGLVRTAWAGVEWRTPPW